MSLCTRAQWNCVCEAEECHCVHVLSGTVSVRQRNVYKNENTNQATRSLQQVLAGHTLTCMNYELMNAYPASMWLVHVGTTHL